MSASFGDSHGRITYLDHAWNHKLQIHMHLQGIRLLIHMCTTHVTDDPLCTKEAYGSNLGPVCIVVALIHTHATNVAIFVYSKRVLATCKYAKRRHTFACNRNFILMHTHARTHTHTHTHTHTQVNKEKAIL